MVEGGTIEEAASDLQPAQLASPATLASYPIRVVSPDAPAVVVPACVLLEQADATIKLCAAPDGRPLLLHVQRSTDVRELV